MASKAELELILSLTDEVSKTAQSIKGELRDVGKSSASVQSVIKDLGKVGIAAFAGAAGAVTALGAGMGKLAIDALPIQGVRDAFQGLTGDADAVLAKLREGSLGMVKDADLMMSYNQAAQLVSQTFADQLPDAMGYLSKVSASTGQDMGFMIDSLVKGVGRLSPMILDNLGIQVALSDATARAAEMFGVEEDALTKAQVQAGMMDVVLEKLAENTASMPDVAGTAAQSWASLGVTFANIKDGVGMALIPALQAILTPIGQLVQTYGPQLVELFETHVTPAIEAVAGALGQMLAGDVQGGMEALFGAETATRIMEIVGAIREFAKQAGAFISEHSEAFKAALIAIGAVLAGAAIASGVMAIGGAIAALANPVTLIIGAVGLLAAAWSENWGGIQEKTQAVIDWLTPFVTGAIEAIRTFWADHGEQIMASLAAMWDWIVTAFQDSLAWLSQAVADTLEWVRTFWADHGEQIMATLGAMWDWITNAFAVSLAWLRQAVSDALEWVRAFWAEHGDNIIATVKRLWETVTGAFRAAVDWISNLIQTTVGFWTGWWSEYGDSVEFIFHTAWNSITTIFNSAIEIIKSIYNAFKSAFEGDWYYFGVYLRDAWDTLWFTIRRVFENAWDIIQASLSIVAGTITGIWNGLKDRLTESWQKLWDSIKSTYETKKEELLTLIRELPSQIIAFFTDTDWGGVGRNIIEGIAKGITSAVGVIKDAARKAAQNALDAAKGFLGIHSPSSVAAEMIGRPFVEGIGEGIDRAMGQLAQTQLANLSARMAAVPVAGGAAHGGSSSASIDYDRLGGAVATAMRAHPTYQISANYRYQDERELRDDLRLLQMLGAAT